MIRDSVCKAKYALILLKTAKMVEFNAYFGD